MNKLLLLIPIIGIAALLLLFSFLKPSCVIGVGSELEYQFPDNNTINATVDLTCGTIRSGNAKVAILENKTQEFVLNTTVPFTGITAGKDRIYFNLTVNTSGILLKPYSYYKMLIYLPGNIYISNSFYADEPINKCPCPLLQETARDVQKDIILTQQAVCVNHLFTAVAEAYLLLIRLKNAKMPASNRTLC